MFLNARQGLEAFPTLLVVNRDRLKRVQFKACVSLSLLSQSGLAQHEFYFRLESEALLGHSLLGLPLLVQPRLSFLGPQLTAHEHELVSVQTYSALAELVSAVLP